MLNATCYQFLEKLRLEVSLRAELLHRNGTSFPGLVQLMLQIVHEGSKEDLQLLLTVPTAIEKHCLEVAENLVYEEPHRAALTWVPGDEPWEQTKRLLLDMIVHQNRGTDAGISNAQALGSASNTAPMRLRSLWWLETVAYWQAKQPASLRIIRPKRCSKSVTVKLLLIDETSNTGLVASLTLYRVTEKNGQMALAPVAASAFSPCTKDFQEALAATTKCCNRHIKSIGGRNTALAWDIVVPDRPSWALQGNSAGAAMGLAALWLLRDLLPHDDIYRHLNKISQEHLDTIYVTASLLDTDRLGRIEKIEEKSRALTASLSGSGDKVTVYVNPDTNVSKNATNPTVSLQKVESLGDLIKEISEKPIVGTEPTLWWRRRRINSHTTALGLATITVFALGMALNMSRAVPVADNSPTGRNDCTGCPYMIRLPDGKAYLGSPVEEIRKYESVRDELPEREVAVSNLMMAETETTYAQWKVCVDEGKCESKTERFRHFPIADLPVTGLTIEDVQAYLTWLRDKSKIASYRLPTEREWEYAARAQSRSEKQTPFNTGATITHADARFGPDPTNKSGPGPVKKYLPNAFNLRDMHGNVGEMTSGCHQGTSPGDYLNEHVDSSSCKWFAVRGGAWNSDLSSLRSAARWHNMYRGSAGRLADTSPDVGFRVARDVE
jgi:formylglycine-generating enzyme required for sulfatase activity